MGRKILKYILGGIIVLPGLLLAVGILIYLPPVQRLVKDKASSIVSNNLGMNLSIQRFNLRFPLTVTLDNAVLVTGPGDTLLRSGRLSLNVSLLPLLRKRVAVRRLDIENTSIHYSDTLSAMDLRAVAETLTLKSANIGLGSRSVDIGALELKGADISLDMGESVIPDTSSSAAAAWKIAAGQIDLGRINFRMRTSPEVTMLDAQLPEGAFRGLSVDLGRQEVSGELLRLSQGHYSYLTDTLTVQHNSVADSDPIPETGAMPWTIRLGRIELQENTLDYGVVNGEPADGFDADHISLSQLNLAIDSIYNRGSDISAAIRSLSFSERSGIEVEDGRGVFSMDSSLLKLTDFLLQASRSNFRADISAGAAVLDMEPDAPVAIRIGSSIGAGDIFIFYPPAAEAAGTLSDKHLTIDADIEGTLGALDIKQLMLEIPAHLKLTTSGTVGSVTDPDRLNGNLRLDGRFTDINFVKGFLPDTALRRRVALPGVMTLSGTVAANTGVYSPALTLTADSGRLDINGRVDTSREIYDTRVGAENFPLFAFLPHDSLGYLTLDLTAAGRSFDPAADNASADMELHVERLGYRGYEYNDVRLTAALENHLLNGNITAGDTAVNLAFELDGEIYPKTYKGKLRGRVNNLDLRRMNFADSVLAGSLVMEADLAAYINTAYMAGVTVDSVNFRHGQRSESIARTTLQASADTRAVTAAMRSGDLSFEFNSPVGPDSLLPRFTATLGEVRRQLSAGDMDMELIQQALPPFTLQVSVGRDNALRKILEPQGLDFNKLSVSASTASSRPLSAAIVVNGLATAGITLDTLNVWARRKDNRLDYAVRLRNRPGNMEQMALIVARGNIRGNTAHIDLYQHNRSDSVGFRFGLNAQLLDSAVRVAVTPENPVFGYIPWKVNSGNFIEYRFGRELYADLRLDGDGQHVYIRSASMDRIPRGAVRVDIAGIDIGELLSMLPAPPAVDGILGTDLMFGMDKDNISVKGSATLEGLSYEKRRIGDIGARVDFQSDSIGRRLLDGALSADNKTILTAKGAYISDNGGNMDFRVDVPSLPLAMVNAFIPEDAARLDGELKGDLAITGPAFAMALNGGLEFAYGRVTVPMIGTSFGILPTKIIIEESRLDFNEFGLTAPNNRPLTLDGSIDARNLSSITADIRLFASNFQAVASGRSGGSQVYGRAFLDADLRARGRVDALSVRGSLNLLGNTDVTYTMQSDPLEIKDEKQNIVTFVPFADTTALRRVDLVPQIRTVGMDMQVNVDISDGVKATVNLADDGSNRIELTGGGNLSYSLNTQGDSRFTGRYNLSGGAVVYNPPVISQKNFNINTESYVEWTGEMADPSFNITATEPLRTTVTFADDSSPPQNVTFDITVHVTNSLKDMALVFDLSSSNARIQNELSSMTPEERSQQAMALLVYNTYTGPSSAGTVDSNNPLNSFISKELNQWARNNLNNIDISVGINTMDNPAGGGQHTDYSYSVSKSFMDDRVKVSVGGSISDQNTAPNLKENFVDDISLEYRLTKRDNMFLKLYRYNTQESILEGEVTETGGGFLVRRKMNRLKELFRFTRDPDKRQQRRQERDVRQQWRDEELKNAPLQTSTTDEQ